MRVDKQDKEGSVPHGPAGTGGAPCIDRGSLYNSDMAPNANFAHASNCVATIMSPCKPTFHDAASNAIVLLHSHHEYNYWRAMVSLSLYPSY